MSFLDRVHYYRRVFEAYLTPAKSQLTFWHETPQQNTRATTDRLGDYYMRFSEKADYGGDYDSAGIPMLDYRAQIGRQYNPIAIAQWGLGNFNLFCERPDAHRRNKFLSASDWLCDHLELNPMGLWVWNHHFDWEYRTRLKAPWYSGLAQGQAISLLVRAHLESGLPRYMDAAQRAFASFTHSTEEGGVVFTDRTGDIWIEEYIVSPPTHILNGFIWAAWGIYDYFLATQDPGAKRLFEASVQTLENNLQHYDLGFWSLYEQSGTYLPMVASPFYHSLHIVQLRIMALLTEKRCFADRADRWQSYSENPINRARSICYKSAFKLCYY